MSIVVTMSNEDIKIKIINSKNETLSISPGLDKTKNNFWVSRGDGEGGDFNVDNICDVIYEALDKYFLANH